MAGMMCAQVRVDRVLPRREHPLVDPAGHHQVRDTAWPISTTSQPLATSKGDIASMPKLAVERDGRPAVAVGVDVQYRSPLAAGRARCRAAAGSRASGTRGTCPAR